MRLKRICLAVGAAAIALAAAYLGDIGGWSLAGPVIGIGVLLVLAPFKALPSRATLFGLLGLFATVALGFLPGAWFGSPEWFTRLRHGVPGLASTLTLEPYQTALWLGILFAASLYGAWLIQWRPDDRIRCLQILVAGIAILAAIALTSDFYRIPIPIWHPSQGFGPFSNRNQTGTLMGLGAIIAVGLAASELRKNFFTFSLWVAIFLLCLAAQLYSNSRASLGLLLAAIMAWFVCRVGSTIKALAIAGGATLLVVTVDLLLGEQVVGRLHDFLVDGVGFRGNIYRDAIALVATVPFSGVGLGNFAAIFPFFRASSLNSMRVIHPESDWLWLASEAGLLAVIFCILIVANLLFRAVRSINNDGGSSTERDVFFAGVIGIVAFLCNTLVDVPAHRLGTILPALFVLAICSSPKLLFAGASWVRWISRAAGISLIVFALALLRASSMVVPSQQAFAKGDWDNVTKNIDNALQIAPLEWSLYLMRGSVNVQTRDWIAALADFRAARVIEPKLAVVPFDEGCAWLGANPKLVVAAWQEALTKRRGDQTLYPQMLDKSLPYPEIQQSLLRLAHTDLDLALEIIETSYVDDATLDLVERERSKLNSDQRTRLDRVESCQYARMRDFRQAYQLGTKTLGRVVFPPHRTITEDECRLLLVRDPSNYAAAYDLCSILASQERKPELLQVLDLLIKQKDCPAYFYVMKGDLLASMNDWSGAWDAISELVARPR